MAQKRKTVRQIGSQESRRPTFITFLPPAAVLLGERLTSLPLAGAIMVVGALTLPTRAGAAQH